MERGCSTVPPMSSLTKISTHLYHLYVFPPCSFVWTHFACRRDLTLGYDDGLYLQDNKIVIVTNQIEGA